MYDIPSMENLSKVVIDDDVVTNGAMPKMIFEDSPKLSEKAS
jgi:ATP-dependent protease Clp ATPase subunit